MDEMNDDRFADLVEEQVRYLRGEGPQPDLSGLTDAARSDVRRMLDLVEAMADSLPPSPPIQEDPVAVRLGLVHPPMMDESVAGDTDPISASAEELSYRFGRAVEVEPASATPLDSGSLRAVLVCRSLAEVVLVVVYEPLDEPPNAADAFPLFHANPDLSAVAFTSPDAVQAAVVTHSGSVDRLVPLHGWRAPGAPEWEPLGIALGRHFDRSMPRWGRVAELPPGDLLEELASEVHSVVAAELSRIARTRPQLSHKRYARESVTALDAGLLVDWVEAVRSGRLSGEELVAQISDACRKESS